MFLFRMSFDIISGGCSYSGCHLTSSQVDVLDQMSFDIISDRWSYSGCHLTSSQVDDLVLDVI